MDATEKAELRDSLRALFAAARTETGAVAAELRDLGWDEVVAEDPSPRTSPWRTSAGRSLRPERRLP